VLVVAHHAGLRIPLQRGALAALVPVRLLRALIYNGYEAVMVFFVISGFLITTTALRRWETLAQIDLRAFYARRFARIVPCLALLVAVLSVLHLSGAHDYVISKPGQSLFRAILSAAFLHLNWYEGRTGYLPGGWDVLWSLSIEEAFYLAFPIVCLVLRRTWLLAPALGLLALSLPVARAALAENEVWMEKAYLPGMAAIAAGVLGALAVARWPDPPRWVSLTLGVAGTAGVLAVLLVEDVLWPVLGNGTVLFLTTSAVCLVAACHVRGARGEERALRGTGWLQSFGRLSYEVYLTHMFVVFAVVGVWRSRGSDLRYGFVWYVPIVCLAWALGALVARFVSIPAERALRLRLVSRTGPSVRA